MEKWLHAEAWPQRRDEGIEKWSRLGNGIRERLASSERETAWALRAHWVARCSERRKISGESGGLGGGCIPNWDVEWGGEGKGTVPVESLGNGLMSEPPQVVEGRIDSRRLILSHCNGGCVGTAGTTCQRRGRPCTRDLTTIG